MLFSPAVLVVAVMALVFVVVVLVVALVLDLVPLVLLVLAPVLPLDELALGPWARTVSVAPAKELSSAIRSPRATITARQQLTNNRVNRHLHDRGPVGPPPFARAGDRLLCATPTSPTRS